MEINNATVLEEAPLLARLRLLVEVGSSLLGKHGLRMKSPQVLTRRRAGVLAHPTSLPGTQLQGTIGGDARRFVDWCVEAKIGVWQVLPLGAYPRGPFAIPVPECSRRQSRAYRPIGADGTRLAD